MTCFYSASVSTQSLSGSVRVVRKEQGSSGRKDEDGKMGRGFDLGHGYALPQNIFGTCLLIRPNFFPIYCVVADTLDMYT